MDMLPVMVWIHGGGLVIGAASTYDGSALSAFENVVVVTIQYRLWEEFCDDELMFKIAKVSGCQSTSSAAMVHCLREKTEEEMMEITLKMDFTTVKLNAASSGDFDKSLLISAVLDGVFFPKSPEELLAEKAINAVPYIIGVNNHEFGWLIPNMFKYPAFTEGLDKETVTSLLVASELFTHVPAEFTYLLTNEYLSNIEARTQLRDRLFELMGDAIFVVPSIQTARYHRDSGSPVYVYDFHHRSSSYEGVRPDFVKVDHGDEIGYVFGKPFLAGDATEEEGKLSKTIMKYWANFARKGNPNGEGLVRWPVYNVDEQYLIIDIKQKAAKKLKQNRVEFWTKTLPKKMAEGKRKYQEL
nr:fatty acyl-CoA hydrolase precursor, medium chain-like [Chelonoidis abingdonii]